MDGRIDGRGGTDDLTLLDQVRLHMHNICMKGVANDLTFLGQARLHMHSLIFIVAQLGAQHTDTLIN